MSRCANWESTPNVLVRSTKVTGTREPEVSAGTSSRFATSLQQAMPHSALLNPLQVSLQSSNKPHEAEACSSHELCPRQGARLVCCTKKGVGGLAHFDAAPGLMPTTIPTTKPGPKPMLAAPGAIWNSAGNRMAVFANRLRYAC